jgi:hypothetical protein
MTDLRHKQPNNASCALAIGLDETTKTKVMFPDGTVHLGTSDLTTRTLADCNPTVIILPLWHTEVDAIHMIQTLEDLAYQGEILVLAPSLPRPALVEQELRAEGPGKRLRLVTLADQIILQIDGFGSQT